MANITQELKVKKPCKIDAPVYDHKPHGWYAQNSVSVQDCVPVYTNSDGGVTESELTDLPTAIKQSVVYLKQKIAEAERLKVQLEMLLENT